LREFFQGWRRKAGLVTLAIALLVMAGWLRTRVITDAVTIIHEDSIHTFHGFGGRVGWLRLTPVSGRRLPIQGTYSIRWTRGDALRPFVTNPDPFENFSAEWEWNRRWQWCGFDFASTAGPTAAMWIIPYWSPSLPLTLLSAWLLLGKRRPVKLAKKDIEPTSEQSLA
jgi:hypothetical protein